MYSNIHDLYSPLPYTYTCLLSIYMYIDRFPGPRLRPVRVSPSHPQAGQGENMRGI